MKVKITVPSTGLFLIFLVLKLTNVIAWSWWWVTAPLWIPILLIATIFLTVLVIGFVNAMLE